MSDRQSQIDGFIGDAGWADATRDAIQADASTRSYTRLRMGDRKAVLMNAPRMDEAPGETEGATVADRLALGYNATARLAGPNLEAFLTVAQELTMRGFSAPKILAADMDDGFILLEDLGGDDFDRVLKTGPGLEPVLDEAAVDTLAAIYRSSFPSKPTYDGRVWHIREYDTVAMMAEVGLLPEWFAPDAGRKIADGAKADHDRLWQDAFKTLDLHAQGLALRDFHAQNLFWLPDRTHEARVGLIDFQDALFAHPAYDLASLLEDARRDVDLSLHAALIERFCEKSGLSHDDDFKAAYAVIAAQRNAKILGIFVRLAVRDNKPSYRALIPRVRAHFNRDLAHPALSGLREWYQSYIPEVLQ